MKCPNCLKEYKKTLEKHPLDSCSLECLKILKVKAKISFKPFNFKMRQQKGRGKFHQQWIAKG